MKRVFKVRNSLCSMKLKKLIASRKHLSTPLDKTAEHSLA